MHSTLIKANIALLEGSLAETQRLLQEYRRENPQPDADLSLCLWLEAHCLPTPEAVIEGLQALLTQIPPDDTYARMAQQYLVDEAAYHTPPPRPLYRQPIALAGLFTLIGIIITVGLIAFFNRVQTPSSASSQTLQAAIEPTSAQPIDLPDASQTLVSERYIARYPQGILNLLALENASQRVIKTADGAVASPIAGARFYALQINFECRSGICDQPPQARITLALDDSTQIEPRTNLSIAGQLPLEPVALGRTTVGWIVFEIPLVSTVKALVITPRIDGEFEPITIPLT